MTAIKTTERKLAEGALKHGNQRLMNWAVGNAKVEPRGNAIMITKQGSGNAKIDALMATFDAVALDGAGSAAAQEEVSDVHGDAEEGQTGTVRR